MIGQPLDLSNLDQSAILKSPDAQQAREMRAVDIGYLDQAIPVQISHADRRQPAVGLADERRSGDEPCLVIDRESGTERKIGLDDDHLGGAIAIHIRKTRSDILEYAGFGEAQDHPLVIAQPEGQGAPLLGFAKDTMLIAWGRLGIAGRDDLGRGGQRHQAKQRPLEQARPEAHQICFSGMNTRRPSRVSETLSWQVRRERAGSGS